ncbi:hypothetical protein BSKO_00776 [Bryopsis sp. KO-2023]|nr:hypothetical protein BSKO_00776 [Bryopsis sp. KO-2023]
MDVEVAVKGEEAVATQGEVETANGELNAEKEAENAGEGKETPQGDSKEAPETNGEQVVRAVEQATNEEAPVGEGRAYMDENPAAIEGLLLLQHSAKEGKDVEERATEVVSITSTPAPCQDSVVPTGPTGAEIISPRRRTVSLSGLYKDMQANPELRDPVARARAKLGEAMALQVRSADSQAGKSDRVGSGEEQGAVEEGSQEAVVAASRNICNPIHEAVQGRLHNGPVTMPVGAGRGKNFYRGVYIHKNVSMPYSVMKYQSKQWFLGYFKTALEAARAWDLAALKRAMESRRPLSGTKLNYPLEEYLDNQSLITALVQSSFDDVIMKLRSASNTSRTQQEDVEMEELLDGQEIPETDDQEGNVEMEQTDNNPVNKDAGPDQENLTRVDEVMDATLVRKPVKQLRTMHSGSRLAQNNWIKRLRDDHKFKGVYFSRDGVPYSKVELEGKYHYLGRFDTMEEAARAYDLATLKRAMIHNQTSVSLNFPAEDYIQDDELMGFMRTANCDQVALFIRNLALNRRGTKADDNPARGMHRRAAGTKRMKPDGSGLALVLDADNRPVQAVDPTKREGLGGEVDWASVAMQAQKGLQQRQGDAGGSRKAIQQSRLVRVRRTICDEKLLKRVSEGVGWVQVGSNTFAVRITQICNAHSDMVKQIPEPMAAWFGSVKSQSSQLIELIDPEFNKAHQLNCIQKEEGLRFSTGWGKFVDDTGLNTGEVLIFFRTDCAWKLRYTVAISREDAQALNATSAASAGDVSQYRVAQSQLTAQVGLQPQNPAAVKPVGTAVRFKGMPQGAQVVQKLGGGRLLVHYPSATEPGKRNLVIVNDPSRYVGAAPPQQPQAIATQPPGARKLQQAKKVVYSTGAPMMVDPTLNLQSAVSGVAASGRHQPMHQFTPGVRPVQLGGAKPLAATARPVLQPGDLAKQHGEKMYLVSDSKGQVRLVNTHGQVVNTSGTIVVDRSGNAVLSPKTPATTQQLQLVGSTTEGLLAGQKTMPIVGPSFQTVGNKRVRIGGTEQVQVGVSLPASAPQPQAVLPQTIPTGLQLPVAPQILPEVPPSQVAAQQSGVAQQAAVTSSAIPEGSGPQTMNELDGSTQVHQVATEEQAPDVEMDVDMPQEGVSQSEAGATGKVPDWYTRIFQILSSCDGLDTEMVTRYKFQFINKMTEVQQRANFMELIALNAANKQEEIVTWVKNTLGGM